MEGEEHPPIAIVHRGAVTALGVDLASLWLAMREGHLPTLKKLKSAASQILTEQVASAYPVPMITGRSPRTRASQLLSLALAETLTVFQENFDPRRVLLYLLLPSETHSRSKKIQPDDLWDAVDWAGPKVKFMPRCFGDVGLGATEHLLSACEALWQNETDAVIFGGIDTLLDKITLQERAEAGLLATPKQEDADIVGEAASMVVLVRPDSPLVHQETSIYIAGLANGSLVPPTHSKQDTRIQTSLIWEALNEAHLNREQIDCILQSGSAQKSAIETWSLVQKEIWPKPRTTLQVVGKVQPLRQAAPTTEPTHLRLARTLGDIGAAMLPLSLGIALSGFQSHQWKHGALILDQLDPLSRGAVVVKGKGA